MINNVFRFILCLTGNHNPEGKLFSDWKYTGHSLDGLELYSAKRCRDCHSVVYFHRLNPYIGLSEVPKTVKKSIKPKKIPLIPQSEPVFRNRLDLVD
jgi:hypothetical protein